MARRTSDTDWVASNDDAAVFKQIYPALHRIAAVASPAECEPDDLVQEATARALRRGSLSQLDNPTAYLARSIVNLASNERRRLGRQRRAISRVQPRVERIDPTYPSDVADLLELSPMNRAVLWLADIEGRSFNDISEMLGGSPLAARARASRARRRLRHLIEEHS